MGLYTLLGCPPNPVGLQNNNANPYTLGVQFQATQTATLTAVWFWSPWTATVLPQTIALYSVSGHTLVHSETASWSGAAGSGWVRAVFASPPALTANTSYKACVCSGSVSVNWFGNTGSWWTTGPGGSGLTAAVLTAPNNAAADGGQCSYNAGSSLAYPATGSGGANYWLQPEVSATLPVSYQAIDGGTSYYTSNGFTNAANAGWDAPTVPVLVDYGFYSGNSTATFKALGLNAVHRVTSDTDLSVLRAAGIQVLQGTGDSPSNTGTETVGWHIEEPGAWSDVQSQAGIAYARGLSGRFLQVSGTFNQFVYGAPSGTPGGTMQSFMTDAISTAGNAHLNIPGDGLYWFAASGQSGGQSAGGLTYLGGTATADQMARGSNYGDMVDMIRTWLTTYPAPIIAPYIENTDGLVGTGGRLITPPEMNWAVWSSLIHGARGVIYFGTTNNYGATSTFGFPTTIQGGQSISIYAQAQATNALIANLAPVINSPFALNYVSATPLGYVFPVPFAVWTNGIDVMAKYYQGQYWIFACTRASETATNISATFTTNSTYTGPVTVVGENRTVQANNGVFSDTFANAWTVHIYQVGTASQGGTVPAGLLAASYI